MSIPSRMHLMRQERDPPEPRFRRLGLTAHAGNQTQSTDVSVLFFFGCGREPRDLTKIKVCHGRGM